MIIKIEHVLIGGKLRDLKFFSIALSNNNFFEFCLKLPELHNIKIKVFWLKGPGLMLQSNSFQFNKVLPCNLHANVTHPIK